MTNRTPPLLPEETLRRVLRVANFDGMSVLAVAGILALASEIALGFRSLAASVPQAQPLLARAAAIEAMIAALKDPNQLQSGD